MYYRCHSINGMDKEMNDSSVSNVPSETDSRNTDLLPEIVRAVAAEFIGVYQHTPPPPVFGFTWGDFVEVIKRRRLFLLVGIIAGAELAMLMLFLITPLK